ncbi:aspartyl protease family protein [Flavobacteriaceae sp. LMIT009]
MKRFFLTIFLFFLCSEFGFSQGKFVMNYDESDKINFELINNLIVIPVEVNGVELSFLLDTGVSKPIIFNFVNLTEELKINQTERIYLRGLGEGDSIEALKSKNNVFKIGKAVSIGQDLFAIFDPTMNFAPKLGVPIHGIIGFDLFKDFVIEINYSKKVLKLYNHESYKSKKCSSCETFELSFYNNKPYIDANVDIGNNNLPVKLLIDSGGSDALWLFTDDQINVPEKYFEDFLGYGLSGSVYGKRSKVDKFSLNSFLLKQVNTAFPDSTSITFARKFKERNGSIGGEILKRFNVIFDYKNKRIVLKKNRYFKSPFYYNKSGIVLEHNGVRVVKRLNRAYGISSFGSKAQEDLQSTMVSSNSYDYILAPSFTIVELRKDSPAHKAGLKIGDVILSVNGTGAHKYSLQQVTQLFFDDNGKRIKLLVDRKGIQMRFQFMLENVLK